MQPQGTSTIVQYTRVGDVVTAHFVHRSWFRGKFVETARWLVPGGIRAIVREPIPLPVGPLGYGREDLLASGLVKPSLYAFDALPCLRLNP